MDVFVTGGTGVLGRATVPRLVAAGHRVRGLSRSAGNDAVLRGMGAEPVRGDLFDPASLRAAVAGSGAVLHLASRIPPSSRGMRASAWADNDRIRREGTRTLVDAGLAAGIGAVVYPSVVFVYPDGGERWFDAETADPAPGQPAGLRSTLAAEAEVARFGAGGGRGIVLRMGLFYGPGSVHTDEQLRLALRGLAVLPGAGDAYQSLVWIGDAGAAVVAALARAPSGVYDVVDDEPMRGDDLVRALADAVGRRRLIRPPAGILRLLGGAATEALTASRRVSNRRFKDATGWEPAVPNARIGLARLARGTAPPEDPAGRTRSWVRAGLALLAVALLPVGLWQLAAPRSFYDGFPGFGRAWVSVDGPYNEHLMRDVGAGLLAVAAVVLVALARPSAASVRTAAIATLVFAGPHLAYHAAHVELLPTIGDRVAQTAGLVVSVVVPALLLLGAGRLENAAEASSLGADSGQEKAPFGESGPFLAYAGRRR